MLVASQAIFNHRMEQVFMQRKRVDPFSM